MQICGLQKMTLLDYPEHLAAIVFLGGCNFCCPYCHNAPLVLDYKNQPIISKEEVFSYLKKRRTILEGVCISGGEPTLSQNLITFMKKLKELGYEIKLDTNGTNPKLLQKAFSLQLLDYVAMDIKSSPENYSQVCGLSSLDLSPIRESVTFLKESGIRYEFRTTVVREFHKDQTFHAIGEWLKGDSCYYLQSFRSGDSVIVSGLHGYTKDEMEHFRTLMLPCLPNTSLRGVEY